MLIKQGHLKYACGSSIGDVETRNTEHHSGPAVVKTHSGGSVYVAMEHGPLSLQTRRDQVDLVQRDVQSLEKLPVHLALVVNERPLSHCDLARMVNWCFCVGVQYVSLYDPRGELCVCEGSHVYERITRF